MMWNNTWELALRLIVSLIAGGAIGWEREIRNKSAGLRTHMLVSLGAAITTLASIEYAHDFNEKFKTAIDPLRVVQGVIGGVGFLGAGAIMQRKRGVRGLTTAASIWTAAAIGITSSMGYFEIVAMSVALVLLTLYVIGKAENHVKRSSRADFEDDGDHLPDK